MGGMATQRVGSVVPGSMCQQAGHRLDGDRLGNRIPQESSRVGEASDGETAALLTRDRTEDRPADKRKRKSSSLTAGPLVELRQSAEESRARLLDLREQALARREQRDHNFFVARISWLTTTKKAVRSIRAKYLAHVLFGRHDLNAKGRLVARVSLPKLVERTRMNEKTVRRALAELVAAGKLHVVRRYNGKERRNEVNEYHACGYRLPRKRKPPF